MTRPELESALSSLDTWILVSGILVAIGIMGEVGFGLRHWALNRRLRVIQHAEEQAHEIATARLANESASAAKDAEEARKDTAAWSARIAEAEARAADANEKAERERLARVKIEARLAPRNLSPEQQRSLRSALAPFGRQRFWVITERNDHDSLSEQMQFSAQLSAVLVVAGWTKDSTISKVGLPLFRAVSTRGVEVGYPDGNAEGRKVAQVVVAELVAANIDSSVVSFNDLDAGIVLNVGLR